MARRPLDQTDPERKPFTPETLDRSLIALPLLEKIRNAPGEPRYVIIDLNLEFEADRRTALREAMKVLRRVARGAVNVRKSEYTDQYLFARMTGRQLRKAASAFQEMIREGRRSPVHRIWEDHELELFTNRSVATVKADAARSAFNAVGEDIVWAVADSGVDGSHPHFAMHGNLKLPAPLRHRDFTSDDQDPEALEASAKLDKRGHGTHVAGIIAGEFAEGPGCAIRAVVRRRDEDGEVRREMLRQVSRMSGVAPRAKILSLKVLDDEGKGRSSNLIAAIAYVQTLNNHGRRLRVHGVNMSVGYDFEPEWFACGQSPLCVEVDRLVRSGVSVVVAAGNTGYGYVQAAAAGVRSAGLDLTINDPGNAELAVTVGSTHRDMPHVYGVSYFSSKGPTGDGRLKPDLVAPGEKIVSCLSGQAPTEAAEDEPVADEGATVSRYREDSGTSMAAPHVSGAIAAFLSVRREFIGRPEAVKEIFLSSATDLKRDKHFQGRGLVDLMRALQAV